MRAAINILLRVKGYPDRHAECILYSVSSAFNRHHLTVILLSSFSSCMPAGNKTGSELMLVQLDETRCAAFVKKSFWFLLFFP